MKKQKPKDLEIVILPEVAKELEDAPEDVKKLFKEMMANFHQAADAVNRGQYKTFADAVEAITGQRPKPVDLDDDETE